MSQEQPISSINTATGQQMIPGANGNNNMSTPAPAPSAPNINYTPNLTALQVLGGSVPQTQTVYSNGAPNVGFQNAGYQNSQAAYAGGSVNINPTQAAYSTYGPSSANTTTSNVDLSNNALASQLYSGLMPQFEGQNRALTAALANAGIIGGSTAGRT